MVLEFYLLYGGMFFGLLGCLLFIIVLCEDLWTDADYALPAPPGLDRATSESNVERIDDMGDGWLRIHMWRDIRLPEDQAAWIMEMERRAG
jgi:hypothetical protein